MYKGYKIVCVTPAGRRRYMRLLAPQILASPLVDRYDVWVNTKAPRDIAFFDALAKIDPRVRLVAQPDGIVDEYRSIGAFHRLATDARRRSGFRHRVRRSCRFAVIPGLRSSAAKAAPPATIAAAPDARVAAQNDASAGTTRGPTDSPSPFAPRSRPANANAALQCRSPRSRTDKKLQGHGALATLAIRRAACVRILDMVSTSKLLPTGRVCRTGRASMTALLA